MKNKGKLIAIYDDKLKIDYAMDELVYHCPNKLVSTIEDAQRTYEESKKEFDDVFSGEESGVVFDSMLRSYSDITQKEFRKSVIDGKVVDARPFHLLNLDIPDNYEFMRFDKEGNMYEKDMEKVGGLFISFEPAKENFPTTVGFAISKINDLKEELRKEFEEFLSIDGNLYKELGYSLLNYDESEYIDNEEDIEDIEDNETIKDYLLSIYATAKMFENVAIIIVEKSKKGKLTIISEEDIEDIKDGFFDYSGAENEAVSHRITATKTLYDYVKASDPKMLFSVYDVDLFCNHIYSTER